MVAGCDRDCCHPSRRPLSPNRSPLTHLGSSISDSSKTVKLRLMMVMTMMTVAM